MDLNNNLSLTQTLQQTTKLSPQQIMGMKMLELPTLELEERIEQELNDNPALEIDDDTASDTGYEDESNDIENENDDNNDDDSDDYNSNDEVTNNRLEEDLDTYFSDDDDYYQSADNINYQFDTEFYGQRKLNDTEDREMPLSSNDTFHDYLLDQIGTITNSQKQRKLVEYIIGNIDDDGFLTRDAHRIENDLLFAGQSDYTSEDIEQAIEIIQSLDPAGVGATDLQQCMILQLKRLPKEKKTEDAIKIVEKYLEELKQKHYYKIQKRLNLSDDELKQCLDLISHLNPKPGKQWNASEYEVNSNVLVPDFYVTHKNGYWEITLNNDNIPHLRVNKEYSQWANNYKENKSTINSAEKETGRFAQKYVNDAVAFIKNIDDRNENLLKTMKAIVKAQEQFFLIGDDQLLKPLVLKDIADKVGLDVSTISRISRMKYVTTDVGTFQLKHFFSESMIDNEGTQISTRSIKSALQDLVNKEDKSKPLTDEELVDIMTKQGFPIARRTVAKYRLQLNIPVARLRKEK